MENETEVAESTEAKTETVEVAESKELVIVKEKFADLLPEISGLSVADQLALDALAKLETFRGMVLVTGDKASLELVKRSRLTCKAVRCALTDACKGAREDAVKVQRKWTGVEGRLVAHIKEIESRLEEQEDAEEKRIADEKKAEAERKQKIVADRLNSLVQTGLLATPERLALAQTATDEEWGNAFWDWKADHDIAEATRLKKEAEEKAAQEAKEAAERAERERVEAESRAKAEADRVAKEAQDEADRAERKRKQEEEDAKEEADRLERKRVQDEADAKAEELRKSNEAAALRSRIHAERFREIVKLDPLAFDVSPEDGTLADMDEAEYSAILEAAKEAGEVRRAAALKVQQAQAERRALENSWMKRASDMGVVLTGRDMAEWTPTIAEDYLHELGIAVEENRKNKELRARVIARVDALASYGCKVAESFEDLTEEEQEKVLAQVRTEWEQSKENEKAVEAKDAESVRTWVDSVKASMSKKPALASAKWISIMEETEAAVLNLLDLSLDLEGEELP